VFEDGVAATRRAAARTSRLVRCMIGRVEAKEFRRRVKAGTAA